jgi:TetR/AcrR family transcriptional repressor of nem operon
MPPLRQFREQDVIDKAMHRFWRYGAEATSVQDLVEATGVNRASLYASWADKRGLFLAALAAYDRDVRQAGMEQAAASLPPLGAIRAILEGLVAQARDPDGAPGCFLTNTALELAAHDAEVRALVGEGQRQAETLFAGLLESARDQGALAPGLDPKTAARRLLSTMLGLAVLVRSRPDPVLLQAIVDDALASLAPYPPEGDPR